MSFSRSSGPPSLSPPLPAGPGGAPRTYSEESLLLISLLRTLWRLSYQDMRDWLKGWSALALACGLPLDKNGQVLVPSKSQQCKRRHAAGAPLYESLFVLVVLQAIRRRLIGARDLIIDSAPILAWRRHDPDAAFGHAPPMLLPSLLGWLLRGLTALILSALLSVSSLICGGRNPSYETSSLSLNKTSIRC